MILINVKFPVRPDRVDEWLAVAEEYARKVNAEEGCVFLEFSRSLVDPHVFVCVEGFRDGQAGQAHMKTDHVAWFMNTAPDLVAERPQIIYVDAEQVEGWGPMGEIQPRQG